MTLYIGKIKEIVGDFAVVEYPHYDNIEDSELLINQTLTHKDKSQLMPQVGSDVIVGETEYGELILMGCFYADGNNRPFDLDVFGIQFEDGTIIKYDKGSKEISISGSSITINIVADDVNINGNTTVSGALEGNTVSNALGHSIEQIVTAYMLHTHGGTVPIVSLPNEIIT